MTGLADWPGHSEEFWINYIFHREYRLPFHREYRLPREIVLSWGGEIPLVISGADGVPQLSLGVAGRWRRRLIPIRRTLSVEEVEQVGRAIAVAAPDVPHPGIVSLLLRPFSAVLPDVGGEAYAMLGDAMQRVGLDLAARRGVRRQLCGAIRSRDRRPASPSTTTSAQAEWQDCVASATAVWRAAVERWVTSDVSAAANADASADADRVLADALLEAGCDDPALIAASRARDRWLRYALRGSTRTTSPTLRQYRATGHGATFHRGPVAMLLAAFLEQGGAEMVEVDDHSEVRCLGPEDAMPWALGQLEQALSGVVQLDAETLHPGHGPVTPVSAGRATYVIAELKARVWSDLQAGRPVHLLASDRCPLSARLAGDGWRERDVSDGGRLAVRRRETTLGVQIDEVTPELASWLLELLRDGRRVLLPHFVIAADVDAPRSWPQVTRVASAESLRRALAQPPSASAT